MKRLIPGILAVLFPLQLLGQMFPLSDNYVSNALAINPAFAGCHDALSMTILYRNQWIGFEDAPRNLYLSVHAPLHNDRIGLGLLVGESSIGIYRETSFFGNYAYRRELFNGKLAFGLGFGAVIYNVAWNDLKVADEGDDQLINNPETAVLPNFSLGTYYYTPKYFIGISLPLMLSHEQDAATGDYKIANRFSEYNYFITGGYLMDVSPDIRVLASTLLKYHPGHTPQVDYNVQVTMRNFVTLGLGYRNKNILTGMLQCQINEQLRMGYSYNFDLSPVGKYRNGSHEVLLNYIFRYKHKVTGPRQF
jgi:type IX secretion system PorP/SprF family membrane protein